MTTTERSVQFRHPAWCNSVIHESSQASAIASGNTLLLPHERSVAGNDLPEIRRADWLPATSQRQDGWSVMIQQDEHDHEGHQYVDEPVVVLCTDDRGDTELRLLPGEARDLAATLIRAADLVLFA